MILAADVGGTKINLALFDWDKERVEPIREDTVYTADYESFEEVLTEFLEEPASPDTESEEAPDDSDAPSSEPTPPSHWDPSPPPVLGCRDRS